jgi:hypothetical protein
MPTLTEIVAVAVVHSSAAALAHFGVTLEPVQATAPAPAQPLVERIVARSPRPLDKKLAICPRRSPTATRPV